MDGWLAGRRDSLVSDESVNSFWTDVVVIWIDDGDLVEEIAVLKGQDLGGITEIEGAIFVEECPDRGEFELAGADDDGGAVCACSGSCEE